MPVVSVEQASVCRHRGAVGDRV